MTSHCVNLETVTASSAHAKSDLAKKKEKQSGWDSKRLTFQLMKVTMGVSRPIELQFRIIVPR